MQHYFTIFLTEPHKYQLWVYIYQARDLVAKDDSGMNGKHPRRINCTVILLIIWYGFVLCPFFSFMFSIKLHVRCPPIFSSRDAYYNTDSIKQTTEI